MEKRISVIIMLFALIWLLCKAVIVVGSRKPTPAAFIVVDPLDEYNHISEVKRVLAELGLRYVPFISQGIARILGDELPEVTDSDDGLCAGDIGPHTIDRQECLEWLRRR